jgi:site-specific DNA-methyltransferase (adenine-specific)
VTTPYWSSDDGRVVLYHGDCREVLPALSLTADLIVADPPYGETSLPWDRWPDGWPAVAAQCSRSMWCFGSLRMFLDKRDEFTGWRLSQDVVWEKGNGSGPDSDRFHRVHELPCHWYRGPWGNIHHDVPRVAATAVQVARNGKAVRVRTELLQRGTYGAEAWTDDGTRAMRSVIQVKSMRGRAIHKTEKPVALLDPLIRYGCPPGGLVVDMFAGSCSTLDAARQAGRRAVGIEADEAMCEKAAWRLSAGVLDLDGSAT